MNLNPLEFTSEITISPEKELCTFVLFHVPVKSGTFSQPVLIESSFSYGSLSPYTSNESIKESISLFSSITSSDSDGNPPTLIESPGFSVFPHALKSIITSTVKRILIGFNTFIFINCHLIIHIFPTMSCMIPVMF